MYDKAAQIERGTENPLSDLSYLVVCTYLTSTEALFRQPLIAIHNDVQRDPANWKWRDVMTELKNNYNSLVVNNLCSPANENKGNKDNQLAAMSAKIDRLELVIRNSNNNDSNSGNKNNNNNNNSSPNQSSNNNSGSNHNLPWWKISPKDGEPKHKIIKGKVQFWCSKCKKWV